MGCSTPEDLPHAAGSQRRPLARLSWGGVPGEQRDENLGAKLAGRPFLAPRRNTSCAEMTQRACARAGFVPSVIARATDFQVLLSLVAAGAGVTLVPRLAAQLLPAGVQLKEPTDTITRKIFAVSRRGGDRKPAVRVVLDTLTEDSRCGS